MWCAGLLPLTYWFSVSRRGLSNWNRWEGGNVPPFFVFQVKHVQNDREVDVCDLFWILRIVLVVYWLSSLNMLFELLRSSNVAIRYFITWDLEIYLTLAYFCWHKHFFNKCHRWKWSCSFNKLHNEESNIKIGWAVEMLWRNFQNRHFCRKYDDRGKQKSSGVSKSMT